MNSINRQQPEHNREDLLDQQAVAKIKTLVKSASTCLFCTAITTGKAVATRPMAVQKVDDRGSLWFLSASDSHQNREILADPNVQLMFQGSQHSDFLTLYGRASISSDPAKIKELWEPMFKTWFTEGIDDPRITVIEVRPSEGYYWDTKHNQVVALAKMVAGAILGKTLDDSVEGTLRV
jgi:general stress protein 26